MKKQLFSAFAIAMMLSLATSCKKDSDSSPVIPADPSEPVPTTTVNNLSNLIPNPAIEADGDIITLSLSGIMDPKNSNNFIAFKGTGTGQNIWIEEDGKNKGILLESASLKSGKAYIADIVFLVDNSGSMYQEADTIASQINAFASFLRDNGIDLRVGVVGYDESGEVVGALNLTTTDKLKKYLTYYSGTTRTKHFAGSDSASLVANATSFCSTYYGSENPIPSALFADKYFTWRSGTSRTYISFTDEPGQPSTSSPVFKLADFKSTWNYTKGTIHTVFSLDSYDWNTSVTPATPDTSYANYYWNETSNYRPWRLSELTGGTIMFIHSDGSDFNLKNINATKALAESFVIKFKSGNASGSHNLKIVVKNSTGTSDGFRLLPNVTYK